ncbi:MAG: UDP-3-O-(3-hydroxymyristoyl)glucosamine N-acyltransferase [Candidatus Cloacimonetes bacterium]|nr:UDP-3-O-(3-hydroxymyristoyl)glucosamine N-acyltransferase [Candidatus Cloacimonadota bacterium]
MKSFKQHLTPQSIQGIIGGELTLNRDLELSSIADPTEAMEHSVVFYDNDKFFPLIKASKAGLILVSNKFKEIVRECNSNLLLVENSYHSILLLMNYWLETERPTFTTCIHETAVIGENVTLPDNIQIGAYVVIEDNVVIGDYSRIDASCMIGKNSKIGKNCHLYPNVSIYEDTELGNNVIIHSGCVIGADGFGYLLISGIQRKIPQIGNVVIHDNVEIGANTTIDRGTISPTVIGEGTKIDNLVQVGHNCKIGKHCILCAQVGLAGSSIVGDYVFLAGQVGLAGHLNIGDEVLVGAQSGVASDIPPKKKYFGTPAREAMHMKKIIAALGSLPDMYKSFYRRKKEHNEE